MRSDPQHFFTYQQIRAFLLKHVLLEEQKLVQVWNYPIARSSPFSPQAYRAQLMPDILPSMNYLTGISVNKVAEKPIQESDSSSDRVKFVVSYSFADGAVGTKEKDAPKSGSEVADFLNAAGAWVRSLYDAAMGRLQADGFNYPKEEIETSLRRMRKAADRVGSDLIKSDLTGLLDEYLALSNFQADPRSLSDETLAFFRRHFGEINLSNHLEGRLRTGLSNINHRLSMSGLFESTGTFMPPGAYLRVLEPVNYLYNVRAAYSTLRPLDGRLRNVLASQVFMLSQYFHGAYNNEYFTEPKFKRRFFLWALHTFNILGEARDPVFLEYLEPFERGEMSARENQIFLQNTDLARVTSAIILEYFTTLDLIDKNVGPRVLLWTLFLDNERVPESIRKRIVDHFTDQDVKQAAEKAQEIYDREKMTSPNRRISGEYKDRGKTSGL